MARLVPRLRLVLLSSVLAWVFSGCEGASRDPGLSALLRVTDAQFVPALLPGESGGPEISSLFTAHNQITPGLLRESTGGTLPASGNAVLVALAGERGHWIVTAGAPAADAPELPTFSAELSFAEELGERESVEVWFHAVDTRGAVGPRKTLTFAVATSDEEGLRVRLRWDSDADLDLHVIDPAGNEIWAGDINSYKAPPPGMPPADRDAYRRGGQLDFDSNGACLLDGRREENVSFPADAIPSGHVDVRVATASMCGEAVAHYEVKAWLGGRLLRGAEGIALPSDTRSGVRAGAGRAAFTFVVP